MEDGIKSLEAFWNELPESNSFRFQFENEIMEMESAKQDIANAEAALMEARNRLIRSWQILSSFVERTAKRGWSEDDIQKAKQKAATQS